MNAIDHFTGSPHQNPFKRLETDPVYHDSLRQACHTSYRDIPATVWFIDKALCEIDNSDGFRDEYPGIGWRSRKAEI